MFQSYKYKNALFSKDGKYHWEYELTDSKFGTVSGICSNIGEAVIKEYSKRNLNVAANLALAFVWLNKNYPYWSIQLIIDYNKNHYPPFSQYEKALQKYLVLL
jgi:hypothetical protein